MHTSVRAFLFGVIIREYCWCVSTIDEFHTVFISDRVFEEFQSLVAYRIRKMCFCNVFLKYKRLKGIFCLFNYISFIFTL